MHCSEGSVQPRGLGHIRVVATGTKLTTAAFIKFHTVRSATAPESVLTICMGLKSTTLHAIFRLQTPRKGI